MGRIMGIEAAAAASAAATNNGRLEVLVSGTNAVLSIGQYMCLDLTANGLA